MSEEEMDALIRALRAVAHGDTSGPSGLELVAIALADGREPSVSQSLSQVASAIHELAEAIRERA